MHRIMKLMGVILASSTVLVQLKVSAESQPFKLTWKYTERFPGDLGYPCYLLEPARPDTVAITIGKSGVMGGYQYNGVNVLPENRASTRVYSQTATLINDLEMPSILSSAEGVRFNSMQYRAAQLKDDYYALGYEYTTDGLVYQVKKMNLRGVVWVLNLSDYALSPQASTSTGENFKVSPDGSEMTVLMSDYLADGTNVTRVLHFPLDNSRQAPVPDVNQIVNDIGISATATAVVSDDTKTVYIQGAEYKNQIIFDVPSQTAKIVTVQGNPYGNFNAKVNGNLFLRLVLASNPAALGAYYGIEVYEKRNNGEYKLVYIHPVPYYHGNDGVHQYYSLYAYDLQVSADASTAVFVAQNNYREDDEWRSDARTIQAFSLLPENRGEILLEHEQTWTHKPGTFGISVKPMSLKISASGEIIALGVSQDHFGETPELSVYDLTKNHTAPVYTFETDPEEGIRKFNLWTPGAMSLSPDGKKIALTTFGCYTSNGLCVNSSTGAQYLIESVER